MLPFLVCLFFSLSFNARESYCQSKDFLYTDDQSIPLQSLTSSVAATDFQYEDTCQNSPTRFTLLIGGNDSVFWNFGDLPSGALNTSTALNPQHIYTVAGSYTVQCIAYTAGLPDTAIKSLTILPEPLIFPVTDTTICTGNTVFLDVTNVVPGFTFQWNDGYPDPYRFIDTDGLYIATVSIGGCIKSSNFTLHTLEEPDVYLGEDTVLCLGGAWLLDATFTSSFYLWQDGSTGPTLSATSTKMYGVQVSNQCGIVADSIYLEFNDCNCNVFFPTAFSPNGDTHNELFNFKYDCLEFKSNLRIFNQWGTQLFITDDPSLAWDGTFKGKKAVEDVYIYVLKYSGVIDGSVQEVTKRGSFLLLK